MFRKILVIEQVDAEVELKIKIRDALKKHEQVAIFDNSQSNHIWALILDETKSELSRVSLGKLHRKYSKIQLKKMIDHFRGNLAISEKLQNQKIKQKNIEKNSKKPILTTVTIHNYNYGRYLEQCFHSVVTQENAEYEIIFSDNASSDESWSIAIEYQKRYPNKITIIRSNSNRGASFNLQNCLLLMGGDLHIQLCSDDYLLPECLETCVKLFSRNKDIGHLIYNRKVCDEKGRLYDEAPFYSNSVEISGIEQAAIYLMAAVNPSISQVCYRNDRFLGAISDGPLARWWAARITDFKMALQYNVGYCSKALVVTRRHVKNDSNIIRENMLEIIGPYLLNQYFLDLSDHNAKIKARYEESVRKLGQLSLKYASWAYDKGDGRLSRQYLYLALALDPSLDTHHEIKEMQTLRRKVKKNHGTNELVRTRSYEPPNGSKQL